MIRSALLSLFLVFSTFAASSPEHLVGTAEPAPAASLRFHPAAASNGTDYFAVWVDDRTGTGSIVGTRVTASGEILDPLGILLQAASGWTSGAQVVWDGEGYLVAWSASDRFDYGNDVYVARVSPSGEIVMTPRLIAENAIVETSRYLASNGTLNALAYVNGEDGFAYIAFFDRNVTTIRNERLASSGRVREPAVAAGTSGFVATWNANVSYSTENDVIEAVAFDATGHVTGTTKTIGLGEHPAVATDGTHYTIAWRRNYQWEEWSLRSRTFAANLEPAGADLTHFTIERQIPHVNVLWLGNHFEVLAVRMKNGGLAEVLSVAVSANGVAQPVRMRNELVAEMTFLSYSPATNGSDIFVARAQQFTGYSSLQVFGEFYRGNSTAPGSPFLLSRSGNAHRDPQIASGPAGYFVAWVEDSGAYATRVDHIGRTLDGRGIRLTNDTYTTTAAAFDGTNWVVAWRHGTNVRVRFISPADGSTVAETEIKNEVEGGWPNVALATSPDAAFVVFASSVVHVARIPLATHVADSVPLTISPDAMPVDYPAASWNGAELLVVWNEQYVHERADPPIVVSVQVWGARVSPGMTLLDPAPLHIGASAENGADGSFSPASVASNGHDWLVVAGFGNDAVVARRVLHGGTLDGDAPVPIGRGYAPVAAWDGSRYAVAWKEGQYWLGLSVLLHAVPAAGELKATNRTLVARETAASRLSIAPAANAAAAVAYTRVSFRSEHAGVERSFFRVMEHGPAPRGRAIRR
jgi:hypothetical protein